MRVAADASDVPNPVNHVTLSGGEALDRAEASFPVRYGTGSSAAGFSNFDVWASNADGTLDTQAGSHPYEFTVIFSPNNHLNTEGYELPSGGETKAVDVSLPPGLVGEPGATPLCTRAQFDAGEFAEGSARCAPDTQVGIQEVAVNHVYGIFYFPIYNLVPPPGSPRSSDLTLRKPQVFIDAKVRSGGDYGITAHSNFPQYKVLMSATTIWGVPRRTWYGSPTQAILDDADIV